MNWLELLLELLKVLGIAGITGVIIIVIVLASVWLIRKITEQILARDLVQFKSDLEKEAIEFKIRYEAIQGERVEFIKEFYKKIVRTYKSFDSFLNEGPRQRDEVKGKEAAKNAKDLVDCFDENKIFFEEELANVIDSSFLSELRALWCKSEASRISEELREYKVSFEQWKSAFDQMQKEMPNVKKQLENKFREIIGIEDKQKNQAA